jgi:hypothetical protein
MEIFFLIRNRINSSTQSMYLEKGKANKAPKVDDE